MEGFFLGGGWVGDLDQFRGVRWGRFVWTIWGGEEWVDHGRRGLGQKISIVFCFMVIFVATPYV